MNEAEHLCLAPALKRVFIIGSVRWSRLAQPAVRNASTAFEWTMRATQIGPAPRGCKRRQRGGEGSIRSRKRGITAPIAAHTSRLRLCANNSPPFTDLDIYQAD